MSDWWNVAVAAIFARELLEAAVILNTFLSLIDQSDQSSEEKKQLKRTVLTWASLAGSVAVLMVTIVGVSLHFAGKDLDDRVKDIIEGFSKIVAAVCIGQLSVKMPKWFGLWGRALCKDPALVAPATIKFNVAWNIWREVAEIGIFLVPFFLDDDNVDAIWASGLIGTAIGAGFGGLMFLCTHLDTRPLGVSLTVLTGWLAAGLLQGGCHELEEVWGETEQLWQMRGQFWNHKELPMSLFKPFGYSMHPTLLQLISFWLGVGTLVLCHIWAYTKASRARLCDGDQDKIKKEMIGVVIEGMKTDESEVELQVVDDSQSKKRMT